MEGIMLNLPDFVSDLMIKELIHSSQDKVIHNKICLAKVMLECVKRDIKFEFFDKLYNNLIKSCDLDLLNILI